MAILQLIMGIGYPVLILAALSWLEPRQTAAVVLVLTGLRLALARPGVGWAALRAVWLPAAGVAAVVLYTAVRNDPVGLLMAPVLVNAALLATFGVSLWSDRPMVERFARLQVEDLPRDEIGYCRSVTKVWCGFFVVNGGVSLALALSRDTRLWALYTGFVSYLLIGLLFTVEYVYRHKRFRRYRGGLADPLLMRLFPPTAAQPSPPRADPRPDAQRDPGDSTSESSPG